jgi:hypothetical protein
MKLEEFHGSLETHEQRLDEINGKKLVEQALNVQNIGKNDG